MKAVWLVQLLAVLAVALSSGTTPVCRAFTTGPLRADPNNVGVKNGAGGTSTKTSTASIIPLSAGIGYDGPTTRFDRGGMMTGGGYGGGRRHGPSRYGYGPRRRGGGRRRSGPSFGSRSSSGRPLKMANYMGNGRRGNEYYGGEYFGNRFDDYSNGNLQRYGTTGTFTFASLVCVKFCFVCGGFVLWKEGRKEQVIYYRVCQYGLIVCRGSQGRSKKKKKDDARKTKEYMW
eukprot:CAMPEP_0113501712 /NCGR_PEP_ID=MMETSP0014_2-20120614/33114_1 /TAXON_ID=2857 /ORGANISM="Nitzschia sp." /LENGTH=230 /DNA_ID=CAMNT_0000396345 /DNA_START=309 /DNA_END=998 /DNA_ORIENTATION=+ /assembly_acc=CAM_ASM_000159